MNKWYIDGVNFHELQCQKYWAPPSSWSKEKVIETTKSRIFSGDWVGARKMDGAFYKFIKDDEGNMELIGRSKGVGGDYLNKIEWVPQLMPFFNSLPNGTCFLGELYFPEKEGSRFVTTITGCLKEKAIQRQEVGDKLHYYIFDVLAYDGESFLNKTAEERFDFLKYKLSIEYDTLYKYFYSSFAYYYSGERLWNMLQNILNCGGEGMVITRNKSKYQPGKRPSKDCMKVKQELKQTIDCVIIGCNPPTQAYAGKDIDNWDYWINIVTSERKPIIEDSYKYHTAAMQGEPLLAVTKNYYYNWAGSLKLGLYEKDGKLTYFGDLSGLTDEVKANWRDYIGKVCEVGGMQITKTDNGRPAIRHPKFIQWRDDKDKKECTWEQVEND